MNQLVTITTAPTVFSFPRGEDDHAEVRTVMRDGEPWFLGAAVLRVLYGVAGGKGIHYRALAARDRATVSRANLRITGGGPAMAVVSEAGLYRLIMRSDKATALPFQDWVTRDVLPTIRKTGGYAMKGADTTALVPSTREAAPLPLELAEALGMAVGQALAPVLEKLTALIAAQRTSETVADTSKTFVSARQVKAMGYAPDLDASEVGYALTVFCGTTGAKMKKAAGRLRTNSYSMDVLSAR
jgi:prophage antirepressor-like protein